LFLDLRIVKELRARFANLRILKGLRLKCDWRVLHRWC